MNLKKTRRRNSRKEYPKSVTDVTEVLRLEEKRFVQGVSYFINKNPKFILKNDWETLVPRINV
jgi:hypothetical protein